MGPTSLERDVEGSGKPGIRSELLHGLGEKVLSGSPCVATDCAVLVPHSAALHALGDLRAPRMSQANA